MNLPQVYTCSPSWTPLPPCTIPLSCFIAPAPSIQYHALNLDWRSVSYMILHMFQCYSPKSSHTFPIPLPSPYHLSRSSQCTSPKHPVSCIEPRLAIRFLHESIDVSMPFSLIIPPSPSPIESKRLFYTSVSLLLSRIQGYRYHLFKSHIHALVYYIGVFLFFV